ncbi:MAG: TetR/AcrR family transcriptional regulator [Clostridiales bacterium]|nr:TetR/AcrR family transcriptional regulator [Clostridiales bacterium]
MTTKQKIIDEALTLFAEKGYSAVYVGEIAKAVGIKAPSLYKHYKSKQDIFNAILDEMKRNYDKQTAILKMNGNDTKNDADIFSYVSEDTLIQMEIEKRNEYILLWNKICKEKIEEAFEEFMRQIKK